MVHVSFPENAIRFSLNAAEFDTLYINIDVCFSVMDTGKTRTQYATKCVLIYASLKITWNMTWTCRWPGLSSLFLANYDTQF